MQATHGDDHSHGPLRAVFGVETGIAGTVYGTVTTLATIAVYGSETHPWKLATAVAGTAAVFWLAHLYAHGLSESISLRQPLRTAQVLRIAQHELGIVLAAVLPTAALLLGALGVLGEGTAIWLAVAVCLATLVADGVRYARLEAFGVAGTLVAIALNVGLGLIVVALKVALSH